MADQVTISTFLELRDNLSEGMKKAAAAIEAATGRVRKVRSDEERAAALAAKAQERAAKEAVRHQLRQHKEIERIANQRERENAREDARQTNRANQQAKEAARMQERITAAQYQEELRRIAWSERADTKKRAAAEAYQQKLTAAAWKEEQRRIESTERAALKTAAKEREKTRKAEEYQKKLTEATWREEQRRLTVAERSEAKKIAAANKAAKEQAKIAERAAKEQMRIADKLAKEQARAADRAARESAKAARQATRASEKAAQDKKPRGLFGTILSADLASKFITSGIPKMFGAITEHYKTVAKEGQEYEDSVNRIALTMAGLNVAPSMRASTREAEGLFNVMREMAAKLPGETQDYIQVFAQGLPDALTAGMTDTKKFADFVSKYTAIAITRGVGSTRAATDLEQILEGRARVTTRTYAELRPYIGMLSKEFNKLTPVERFERLQKAVEKASTGIGAVAESANAKFGELESHLKEIYTIGEQPLFEAIKSTVSDINELFVKNKKEILSAANVVATTLGDALRGIIPILSEIGLKIASFINTIDSSPVLKETLNFLSFQMLDRGATARRSSEATKEIARIGAGTAILKKYRSLIPSAEWKLTSEEMDRYLQATWRARKGSPVEMEGAIQSKEDWDAFVTAVTGNADKAQELWKQMIAAGDVQTKKMPHTAPTDVARNYNDFRHSNFNIKQEFAEGFDPDRIAVAFASDLARVGEMKLQAAYTLTGAVR